MSALFDSGSKENIIDPTFARELGFFIRPTDVRAPKNDNSILANFEIVSSDGQGQLSKIL